MPRWSSPARIAANGPLALVASKRILAGAVRLVERGDVGKQRAIGAGVHLGGRQGGRDAFKEKREPVWKGR